MIWIIVYLYAVGALASWAVIAFAFGDDDNRRYYRIWIAVASWPVSVPLVALMMV